MPIKVAFSGLKHSHVQSVIKSALVSPLVEVVGIAEDHDVYRDVVEKALGVTVSYRDHKQLLESLEIDLLVVVEQFARRGEAALDALRAGKHVFADKPLCTTEDELWQIARLSGEKGLEVGVDFSFRHMFAHTGPPLQQGEIGEIVSCVAFGPHSLNYGKRPMWYFEPGMHGGTINDLLGHGVDYISWITGKRITEVLAASVAHGGAPQQAPEFETLGEAYYRLEGGGTAFGRVDYLVPAGNEFYKWQFYITGTEGDAFVQDKDPCMTLRRSGAEPRTIDAGAPEPRLENPFLDMVHHLVEGTAPLRSTDESLTGMMTTLVAQRAANTGKCEVAIPMISRAV
jgi:predicted dehydrogenase